MSWQKTKVYFRFLFTSWIWILAVKRFFSYVVIIMLLVKNECRIKNVPWRTKTWLTSRRISQPSTIIRSTARFFRKFSVSLTLKYNHIIYQVLFVLWTLMFLKTFMKYTCNEVNVSNLGLPLFYSWIRKKL